MVPEVSELALAGRHSDVLVLLQQGAAPQLLQQCSYKPGRVSCVCSQQFCFAVLTSHHATTCALFGSYNHVP